MEKQRCEEISTVVPARVGRENQRYESGKRLVVGTVAFELRNDNSLFVLLVNSVKHADEWTMPKGGWEIDESAPQGAMRETLEEAGARGEIVSSLAKEELPTAPQIHEYFALRIERLEEDWAEMKVRKRKMVAIGEAISILSSQSRRKDKAVQVKALKVLEKRFG